ncbi:MAG: 2-dehydropantoate 2-reductase [Candidatus Omnitrophica bacterium]|nr:2-dehydropantoate 2-reductase [Candidatus Omnitrophota bacterium]MDD5430498.1 2-dehydropantoate 2-reductase [Candidatus Omnitrophota bacterium]
MKIAIIGAGAIGSIMAGYLTLQGQKVILIGRKESVEAIKEKGLSISGVRGELNVKVDVCQKLEEEPDLVILAVKTQDIEPAMKAQNVELKGVPFLAIQNGIRAKGLLKKYTKAENIISSIVMFGATKLGPGKIVHNFEGSLILESPAVLSQEIASALRSAFELLVVDDITGMKWLKVFVNANNCIPAILGQSMQECFSDLDVCRISIAIWKEGLDIVNKAGIKLVSLPDFEVERINKLTSLAAWEAANIFSGIMTNLSKEPLYGSILQSIKNGKSSEIDYINGEFIELAKACGIEAPLNRKLVEMVHLVEKNKSFFETSKLLGELKELLN